MGRGHRGGGRAGCGGGSFKYAKQEPFVCFPDAELHDIKGVTVDEHLIRRSLKLQHYWKAAPCYLEESISKKGQSSEIERFSDKNKVGTTLRRDSLSQILEHKNFPIVLTEGPKGRRGQLSRKKVQRNPDFGTGHKDKEEKKKKEGENEVEDEDLENDESEEEPNDDDYDQNVDFDDDEDDFNVDDDVDGADDVIY